MMHPLLNLGTSGDGRYTAPIPGMRAEERDVVYSGQLVSQSLIAAHRHGGRSKTPRSIHSVFARAGTYGSTIELAVDELHSGATWASCTVTATQGGTELTRSLVLQHLPDADLLAHGAPMPDVPGPDGLPVFPDALAFPGADALALPSRSARREGTATLDLWHRYSGEVGALVEHQAVVAWATAGPHLALAMRDHADVSIHDAHVSVSTGVIAHTLHFLGPFDVRDWLLLTYEATHAGEGRVHGQGRGFTADGRLVLAFHQDAMARAARSTLDPRRSM